MKVLIVSDSHGLTEELQEIKARHAHEVQMMIHCGDSELQADEEALEDFLVVQGNCDFIGTFPEELVEEIDGYRIFITHGHRYGVKSTLLNLSLRAQEADAKIVCFGHSHFLGAEMNGNEAKLHVHDLNHGRIDELTKDFLLPKRN